jgi:predicted nucleic acid-binding Zn ribbon protein
MSRDLAREMYRAFRNSPRKLRRQDDENRSKIDDPKLMGDVLNELISKRDWVRGLAEGNIFTDWKNIVGEEVAQHALPISIVDGRLTIQSSSTAWATQLNLMKENLLKTISSTAPGALVEELFILGPNVPNWKKGLRTIRGARGPRDTYG